MIRFADSETLPSLKALWREAFGDSEEYIDFFFERRFYYENALVFIEDRAAVSMLHLLPASILTSGGEKAARYIYGVATKREYRGRGFSSELLKYAALLAERKGEALFLVPSGKELFNFYRSRGYNTFFYLDRRSFNVPEARTETVYFQNVTAGEYKQIRDGCFASPGYIVWDEAAVAYAIGDNAMSGGETVSFLYGNRRHIAMFIKEKSTLYIKETTVPLEDIPYIFGEAAKIRGCNNIEAALPARSVLGSEPFGMIYGAAEGIPGYLGLALN